MKRNIIILILFTPVWLFSQALYTFMYEKGFSAHSGAENLIAANYIYATVDKNYIPVNIFKQKKTIGKMGNIAFRLVKYWYLDYQLNIWGDLVQHEYFGHTVRAKQAGFYDAYPIIGIPYFLYRNPKMISGENYLPYTVNERRIINSFDAIFNTEYGNIDDDIGHGTVMAEIAAGNRGSQYLGVAPEAFVIDAKAISTSGESTGNLAIGDWNTVVKALDWIIEQQEARIINLSFSQINTTTGEPLINDGNYGTIDQLVNYAVSQGIVCVASAGNHYKKGEAGRITSPGTATRAITVTPYQDLRSINRSDDTFTTISSYGPIGSDETIEQQKPDIAAPGVHFQDTTNHKNDWQITTASLSSFPNSNIIYGSSVAAAHVSGIAALILQYSDYSGINISPEGVKDILFRSATKKKGNSYATHGNGWNEYVGHGFVDAYKALRMLNEERTVDVTFKNWDANFPYYCPGIEYDENNNKITVTVNSDSEAQDIYIDVGIHKIGIHQTAFQHIGTRRIANLIGDSSITIEDVPSIHFDDSGTFYKIAVEAVIRYGLDSDFSNNKAVLNFYNYNVAAVESSMKKKESTHDDMISIDFPFLIFTNSQESLSLTFSSEYSSPDAKVSFDKPEITVYRTAPPDTVVANIQIDKNKINDDIVHLRAYNGNSLYGGIAVKISDSGNAPFDPCTPSEFILENNFPNPFSSKTNIQFKVKAPCDIQGDLTIYNILGQKVKSIIKDDLLNGNHSLKWNATNEFDMKVAEGIYFLKLSCDEKIEIKKIILLHGFNK